MKNLVIFLFGVVILASSCSKNGDLVSIYAVTETLVLDKSSVDDQSKLELPSFPHTSLHLLQREYQIKKKEGNIKLPQGQYLENRLLELYPEMAYKGMYEKALKEMQFHKMNYNDTEESYDGIEQKSEYQPFTTVEAEIKYMAMTKGEIKEFKNLESAVSSNQLITRELLNKIATGTSARSGIIAYSIVTAGALVGYSSYRIWQSRNRAENKANELYPGQAGAGKKGDAFRHIYVSMLLRRYLTQPASWAIMGMYETVSPNPDGRDTHMDYHNNKVGRDTQYWTFRGHVIYDRYKWEKWATNARNWVNNSSNGEDMEILFSWDTNNPNHATAKSNEETISNSKYIYYAN